MSAALASFLLPDFWIGVAMIAGIYAIFTLGLQLNFGFTGMLNFGQAGFMAIGAYAMACWSRTTAGRSGPPAGRRACSRWRRPSWSACPRCACAPTTSPSPPSPSPRSPATSPRTPASPAATRACSASTTAWLDLSDRILAALKPLGLGTRLDLPLLLAVWACFAVLAPALALAKRTPWGRVLRAIREDEDAAAALGKNTLAFKLQSLALSALLAAVAGWFLALQVTFIYPSEFEPMFTFFAYAMLVLGGLGSSRGWRSAAILLWVVLEGTRLLDLPLSAEQFAALRFVIVGLILIC